jgi:phage shock protein A
MAINNVESTLADRAYIAALEQKIRDMEARMDRMEGDIVEARRR